MAVLKSIRIHNGQKVEIKVIRPGSYLGIDAIK